MLTILLALALGQQAGNGSWSDRTPLPLAPGDLDARVAASTGGLLYVAGAPASPRDAMLLYAYSPVTDAWTSLAGVPSQSLAYWSPLTAAPWNGDLLVFGNYMDDVGLAVGTTVAWRYRPATDAWSREADCPQVLDTSRAATGPNCVYLAGGWEYTGTASVSPLFEFNGAWTRRGNLPRLCPQPTVAYVDDRLVVTGAPWNPSATELVTWLYTPATGWTTAAAPPGAGIVSAVVGKRLYLLSSYSGGWPVPANIPMLEYNAVSDLWTQRTGPGGIEIYLSAAVSDGLHVYATTYPERTKIFNPPDYGSPPDAPTDLVGPGPWSNGGATFSARVTDPDVDQVRLDVEINGTIRATGALGAEGIVGVSTTLAEGHYSWRCRAIDWNENASPWVKGTDFDVDTTTPWQVPTPLRPVEKFGVPDRTGGSIRYEWEGVVEDGGAPMGVEIQVARDPQFTSVVPSDRLACGFYYWRLRARDAAGNVASAWSTSLGFEVWWDDAVDHGAGDGCSVGVGARFQLSAFSFLLITALFVIAMRRR